MIRSRNQNSFLAVATLGVYLGLILAGATPLVLAQAATAKQFNVKDEVEYTENLDRKPAEAASRSDERLNAKISASVKKLVSKVRASGAPIATLVVVSRGVSTPARRVLSAPVPIASERRSHPSDLVGIPNLARAGIA